MALDRTQVVQGAIELIQLHGVTKLSMRSLARHLNASTMTLYNHVSDRQDLLNAIVEQRWSQLDISPNLTRTALAYYRALRAEPWLVPLFRETRSSRIAQDMSKRLKLDSESTVEWIALTALAAGLAEYEAHGHATDLDWEGTFTTFSSRLSSSQPTPTSTGTTQITD